MYTFFLCYKTRHCSFIRLDRTSGYVQYALSDFTINKGLGARDGGAGIREVQKFCQTNRKV